MCHFFVRLLNSLSYLLFVRLSLMHPGASPPLQLTPIWTLQADCFLIDGVPEVVVVMVTWERALGKPRRWKRWLGEGGKGHPLKKNEGSTHARLGWSLQKIDPPTPTLSVTRLWTILVSHSGSPVCSSLYWDGREEATGG